MISVTEALDLCLALGNPVGTETIPIDQANGRVLAAAVNAQRAQPPFASSAMDGYAMQSSDAVIGQTLTVIGESAAGHGWNGRLASGECVRIFTGAPVPVGADTVVIQEDVTRQGGTITINPNLGTGANIRPAGVDFDAGFSIDAPRLLRPVDLALFAAMNVPQVSVFTKPTVGILATGDELVMPGEAPTSDQIISSNVFAIKAMIEDAGGIATILPIAPDTEDGLKSAMRNLTQFDVAITIGGASVGEYDLVGKIGDELGLTRSFYKIAMRPGKPLIAGQFGARPFLGLPGNPVSSIVCAKLFVVPLIKKMVGRNDILPTPITAQLAHDLPANGPRLHYMRGTHENGLVTVANSQDSSLLSVLAASNCLIIRPIGDADRKSGETVEILPL